MKQNEITFIVAKHQDNMLLKDFLRNEMDISEKSLRKLKSKGQIICNGERVTVRKVVSNEDEITLIYPKPEQSEYLFPQFVPLDIVYEDTDILVINKPANLCVHPTKNYPEGTLANGVLFYWQKKGEEASYHIINRLDKDTSGLVLIAKNKFSAQQLFLQQEQQILKRYYLALVEGEMIKNVSTINAPIDRIDARTTKREINILGQKAITHYKVVQSFEGFTLVELSLETGRTHQIRVHMSFIGHPLVGDNLYDGKIDLFPRQFLHAYKLFFQHPRLKKEMDFQIDFPEKMTKLLNALK